MNQSLLRRHHVEIFLLALLLIIFCGRIWSLGITTTDDAWWALWVHQPDQRPVMDFAINQGRFWAFGGGAWLRYGLFYAGTAYGDFLIVASFLLFFALFLRAVSIYWSTPTAYLTGGIFLAIFALRADRSILTAYPLFFWMPASAVISGLLAARRYQHHGGLAYLGLSVLLLLVGMFNNEGATALTLLIVPLAVWANHLQRPPIAVGSVVLRTRHAAVASALVLLGFVAVTAWWRLVHPSTYAGNTLAPFDAIRILTSLFNFSFSGIIFFDFFHPYAQTYADALAQSSNHIVYDPVRFIVAALKDETSLIVGGAVLLLLLRTWLYQADSGSVRVPARSALIGCLIGLAITLVLLLPVAMTSQYQNWFYQYDSHAYSHTIFASFGIALILAQLSGLLVGSEHLSRPLRIIGAAGLAVILGFTAMVGNRMNDAIANDIRPEAARWRVLKDLVAVAKTTGTEDAVYYAPRFRSGSWFDVVPSTYWSEYARLVYGSSLRVTDDPLDARDIAGGADYVDYQVGEGRNVLITALHLAPAPNAGAVADRITVMIDGTLEPTSADAILSFQDRRQGSRQFMLRDLRRIGRGIWTIDGIAAETDSVRIAGQATLPWLRIGCGDHVAAGQVMQFGRDAPSPGCYAAAYLKSGWAPLEATGTWSTSPVATLQIPTENMTASDLDLVIDASSYSGMGFYDRPQTVRVAVNGRPVASWQFGTTSPSPITPITLHAEDWQEDTALNITFETSPLLNPKQLGKADDTRNLGLFLRSVVIRPKPG